MYHICSVYIYPLNGYQELNSFEEPCFTLVATITSFAREINLYIYIYMYIYICSQSNKITGRDILTHDKATTNKARSPLSNAIFIVSKTHHQFTYNISFNEFLFCCNDILTCSKTHYTFTCNIVSMNCYSVATTFFFSYSCRQ